MAFSLCIQSLDRFNKSISEIKTQLVETENFTCLSVITKFSELRHELEHRKTTLPKENWKHIKQTISNLDTKISSLAGPIKENNNILNTLTSAQLLIINEKNFLQTQHALNATQVAVDSTRHQELEDHLQLYQVQTSDLPEQLAKFSNIYKSLRTVSIDLLVGPLGEEDAFPEIRKAALDGDPNYIEWLMSASIIYSVLNDIPMEIFSDQDQPKLTSLQNIENIAELFNELWESPQTLSPTAHVVVQLKNQFRSEAFPRAVMTDILEKCSYESIIYDHYSQKTPTLEQIAKMSEPVQKGMALKAFVCNSSDEEEKIKGLQLICDDSISRVCVSLQDFVIEKVSELNQGAILRFYHHILKLSYSKFEIAYRDKDSLIKLQNFLNTQSTEQIKEFLKNECRVVAEHYVKKDDLIGLLNFYNAFASVDDKEAAKYAFLILKPFMEKNRSNNPKTQLFLEALAHLHCREKSVEKVTLILQHIQHLLKNYSEVKDLNDVKWDAWLDSVTQSLDTASLILPLFKLYEAYIPQNAIDIAWNNIIGELFKNPKALNETLYNTLYTIQECSKTHVIKSIEIQMLAHGSPFLREKFVKNLWGNLKHYLGSMFHHQESRQNG